MSGYIKEVFNPTPELSAVNPQLIELHGNDRRIVLGQVFKVFGEIHIPAGAKRVESKNLAVFSLSATSPDGVNHLPVPTYIAAAKLGGKGIWVKNYQTPPGSHQITLEDGTLTHTIEVPAPETLSSDLSPFYFTDRHPRGFDMYSNIGFPSGTSRSFANIASVVDKTILPNGNHASGPRKAVFFINCWGYRRPPEIPESELLKRPYFPERFIPFQGPFGGFVEFDHDILVNPPAKDDPFLKKIRYR